MAPTYQCPRLTERDHKEHSIRQAGRMVILIPVDLSSESQPIRDLKRGSQWQALYGAVAGAESRAYVDVRQIIEKTAQHVSTPAAFPSASDDLSVIGFRLPESQLKFVFQPAILYISGRPPKAQRCHR